MRYSRFKKQMDAATGNLPPPTPRKPRKNRVEKTKSVKKEKKPSGVKTERDRDEERGIKTEGKGKQREIERGFKSEYGIREGTGESLLSSSVASMSGSLNRDTPDLEGGLSMMPSPAVSLAQHDLSSGLNHHHLGDGLGMSPFQASSNMSFADAVQVKRERKPSAKTLNSGLFANMQGQGQAQSRSPHLMSEQLHLQMPMQNGTSSVSTSTHPSTPRMCIEEHEHEQTYPHSHPNEYSPHHNPSYNQSPHGHAYHHDLHTPTHTHAHAHPHDSFGLVSLGDDEREMDDLLQSFGMPSSAYANGHGHGTDLYSPLMVGGEFPFGMGGDGYEEFWGGNSGNGMEEVGGESERERERERMGGGAAVVKKEERWEEAYRR